jgi:hypothetical protein
MFHVRSGSENRLNTLDNSCVISQLSSLIYTVKEMTTSKIVFNGKQAFFLQKNTLGLVLTIFEIIVEAKSY